MSDFSEISAISCQEKSSKWVIFQRLRPSHVRRNLWHGAIIRFLNTNSSLIRCTSVPDAVWCMLTVAVLLRNNSKKPHTHMEKFWKCERNARSALCEIVIKNLGKNARSACVRSANLICHTLEVSSGELKKVLAEHPVALSNGKIGGRTWWSEWWNFWAES